MAITNGYATLNEVKAALRIPAMDSVDDSLLEMAIESASRLIDGYASRSFYNAGTASRIYVAESDFYTPLEDAITITEVATSSDADGVFDIVWAATDYQTEPLNGRVDGLVWPINAIRAVGDYTFPILGGEACVKVTGVWGWSAVPIQVKQACVIQASRIFKRLDSPLGVISGEFGLMRVGTRLDPDVAMLVDPYKILRMA
jgi:hypothetical protein